MKKKFQNLNNSKHFFTRMLLICTALLISFSIVASILVGFLSFQYEKSQFLKTYDLAMVNLSESFFSHIDSFSALVGKILKNDQCDDDLCSLLEASTYEEVPANVRKNVITLLSSFTNDDRYLRGVLLYSPINHMLYYYSISQSYLSYTNGDLDLPEMRPFSGTKIDNKTLEKAIRACTRSNLSNSHDTFYGIAATLYKNPNDPLGYLIPLFSTAELSNVLENYQLDSRNIFQITDSNGYIYFQSNNVAEKNRRTFFTNRIVNNQYDFIVSYDIYRSHLPKSQFTILIILLALIVTLFSFILYYITYYLCNKNINGILIGMERFRLSNLSYRIPRPNGSNEFTQIIDGFNKMCEELQQNVARSYVYELQQKKSELYALQTSINPHFLYNTLEMIRSQILNSDNQTASHMLLLLAKIYRIQTNTTMFITIEDEVDLCENFIILYQNRFQNFDYEFDIEDDTRWYGIPKNTIQPMIENYFVHGIKASQQDNLLRLSVLTIIKNDKKYVCLTLSNNGNSISLDKIIEINEKLNSSIYDYSNSGNFALSNVYNRLRIAFQDDCQLTLETGMNEVNFQITLTFPALTVDELKSVFIVP